MTGQTLGRRNAALVQGTELDLALRRFLLSVEDGEFVTQPCAARKHGSREKRLGCPAE
jgi:hypothetical protein